MKKKSRPRAYDSSLRKEQAEVTAARILDAVQARLAKGDRELRYAAIAKEAGVSVPTVYRHYPTPDDIFRAFSEREGKRHGYGAYDRASLPSMVEAFFGRFDDPDDMLQRSQRLHTIWQFSRVGTVPHRRRFMEQLLDEEAPHLTAKERAILIDLGVVTFSSAIGEAMRGYLELDGKAMAERVLFLFDALFARAKALSDAHAASSGRGQGRAPTKAARAEQKNAEAMRGEK